MKYTDIDLRRGNKVLKTYEYAPTFVIQALKAPAVEKAGLGKLLYTANDGRGSIIDFLSCCFDAGCYEKITITDGGKKLWAKGGDQVMVFLFLLLGNRVAFDRHCEADGNKI